MCGVYYCMCDVWCFGVAPTWTGSVLDRHHVDLTLNLYTSIVCHHAAVGAIYIYRERDYCAVQNSGGDKEGVSFLEGILLAGSGTRGRGGTHGPCRYYAVLLLAFAFG